LAARKSPPLDEDFVRTLELLDVRTLTPHPRNDGSHPPGEIAHLRQSIREHGIYRNVVVANDGTILAGHGVVAAAQAEGRTHIPGQRRPYGPDDPRALKLLVGDNGIPQLRQRDDDVLVALLQELAATDPLALLGTGFDEAMLEALIAQQDGLAGRDTDDQAGRDVEPEIDRAEELRKAYGVEPGQLWACGEHRILCGDCTDKAVVERLMQDRQALLCHADPPYGMGKEAEGIANDNLYASKLDAFQMQWWRAGRAFLADNASAYIWGNAEDLWRLWYQGGLRDSERLTFRNEVVWNKAVAGENPTMLVMGVPLEGRRMYQPTERCFFFMLGEQGFSTNADNYWEGWEPIRAYLKTERDKIGWDNARCKALAGHSPSSGCHWFDESQWMMPTREVYEAWQRAARGDGFKRDYDDLKRDYYATRAYFDNTHDTMTDVWDFPRVRGEERQGHPTPKPVALIERMIQSSTPAGALVYDPFLGSGTTLVSCANLGRVCYGCEIDPGYTAVILERYAAVTGEKPARLTT
jgi:DNA modification methylase